MRKGLACNSDQSNKPRRGGRTRKIDGVKRRRVVDKISIDRLSELPDDLILNIISLLNAKSAVQTCILSKRWTHIWTLLPNLHFDSRSFSDRRPAFQNFLFHILSCQRAGTICSLTFLYEYEPYLSLEDFAKVFKYATEHGVLEIYFNHYKCLTPCFLSCQSLRNLKIERCGLFGHMFSEPVFSSLTTLHLRGMRLAVEEHCHSFNLISSCVNLEELILICVGFNRRGKVCEISCPRLVKLTMLGCFEVATGLIISAPRLSLLNYGDIDNCFGSMELCLESCPLLKRVDLKISYYRADSRIRDWYEKVIRKILFKTKLLVLELSTICKFIFKECNKFVSIEIHDGKRGNEGKMCLSWKLGRTEDAQLSSSWLEDADALERVGLLEFFGRIGFVSCLITFMTSTYKCRLNVSSCVPRNLRARNLRENISLVLAELPAIRVAIQLAWDNMFSYIEEQLLATPSKQTGQGDTPAVQVRNRISIADYRSFLIRRWQFKFSRTYRNEVLWQFQWPNSNSKQRRYGPLSSS